MGLLALSGEATAAELHQPRDCPQTVAIRVDVAKTLFRLSDLMIGANLEDLHYQMTGGLSSQLIHGESFFEPSPTELAPQIAMVAGFTNVGKTVAAGGELSAFTARLTSQQPATDVVETGVEVRSDATGPAGLIVCVSPCNAYNGWEWYFGYTVEVDPRARQVVLSRASRPNHHHNLKRVALPDGAGAWIRLSISIRRGRLTVGVDGRPVIEHDDPSPLAPALYGLVARGDARFRMLWQKTHDGRRRDVPLEPNPLLKTPGDPISLRWAKIQTGAAQARFARSPEGGWHPGKPSQQVSFVTGQGEVGVDNAGLQRWGIALQAGKPYEGFLRVKTPEPTEVHVSLRSADGSRVYADQALAAAGKPSEYQRLDFTLTPSTADADGRFAVTLKKPGTMTLGYAFLQPGAWGRYKGLPVRRDLAEALIAQGVRLVRFNGGMIERPDYRWQHMQGPRDHRPPYDGFYDRWCSNGFGPVELLAFCEAAGLVAIPGLNVDETPEAFADFVAYCNAPADRPAGQRRAADGHPAPYRLRYLQIGNETQVDAGYAERFKRVAKAVWQVDPEITLLPCGNVYNLTGREREEDVRHRLKPHLEIVRFARENGQRLLWDGHAFNTGDELGPARAEGGHVRGAVEFSRWLSRLEPACGAAPVGLLEFNAARADLRRGLQHAVEMNVVERAGDRVRAAAMPNVSQPWGVYQNDWKAVLWTQGNLCYNQQRVWFQPAAYVDQMIARSWAPLVVPCDLDDASGALDIVARKSDDGKRLVLQVVNTSGKPVAAEVALAGFTPTQSTARREELTGPLDGCNTLEQPERIRPASRAWSHGLRGGRLEATFAPQSFTIIELK